jgi:IS30 family transposase
MSGKTIYNYVFSYAGETEKSWCCKTSTSGGKKGEQEGETGKTTLIDTRPAETNAREVPGHWEGDLIIGQDHKSAILVAVERKTRFVQMDVLESMDARVIRKTIEKRFKKLEPALRKFITFDQGKENSEHKQFSENTAMAVYFCHPHSPWEKGTCENTNYLIRDMLYPVDDFRKLSQRAISKIARLLNERPRRTLDFRTPYEVFSELRQELPSAY